MISGVTSAQIIIAEQQSDSVPWLLDKTAKPLRGGKDDAKTLEPPPADVGGSDEAKTSKRLPTDAGRKDKAKTPEHLAAEKRSAKYRDEKKGFILGKPAACTRLLVQIILLGVDDLGNRKIQAFFHDAFGELRLTKVTRWS